MTKIISLPTKDQGQSLPKHLEAGWLLVYTALWQHDHLPRPEIAYGKKIIRHTLTNGEGRRAAFLVYCERILLANRVVQAEPAQWVDIPSIWFHPDYGEGFTGTLSFHKQYIEKRQTIPGYQQGIATFAAAYWDYVQSPTPITLKICHRRLLKLREYGLLQLWNNVIMLHQSK